MVENAYSTAGDLAVGDTSSVGQNETSTVFLDESTAGQFVTTGLVLLPSRSLLEALACIEQAKSRLSIPTDARIHCRVLFHAEARRKSEFDRLSVDEIDHLLMDCVTQLKSLGASYLGAWVDRTKYPNILRLVDGEVFRITDKHLAGILSVVGSLSVENRIGPSYRLVYDPDRTKLDWGVAKRMQATHFARIMTNSELPSERTRPLLDMADVIAYSFSHALLAGIEPGNRKLRRFPRYVRAMALSTSEFFWNAPAIDSGAGDPA